MLWGMQGGNLFQLEYKLMIGVKKTNMVELTIFTGPNSDFIMETLLNLARTNTSTFCHTNQQFDN
jgi:hypothetical protein